MEFVHGDKKYRFDGAYRAPKAGDRFLSNDGYILLCSDVTHYPDVRAIVTPVPDKVVVGGIEWEIVDERVPQKGEWILDLTDTNPWLGTGDQELQHRVIRPVRIL